MKHTAFHWPDHVIGKRESRRIRDAHNALFNSHAELLEALRKALAILNTIPDLSLNEGLCANEAKSAIRNAQ